MNIEQMVILDVMTQTTPAGAPAPTAQAAPARPVAAAGMPGDAGSAGGDASKTLAPGGGTTSPTAAPQSPMGGLFYVLPLMLVVMVVMSMLTGRKEKKKREELMKSIQRGDKVITTGGIIGTITELSEVDAVLKVEDGRIRVTRAAMQGVTESKRGGATASVETKPEAKALA
ncbi:MAG: preprotein translocase subunit YajC [Phycisphaerales bacterium]